MGATLTAERIEAEPTVELAPLLEGYSADGLAFAVATRDQSALQARWVKRVKDQQATRRLRRG